MLHLKPHAVLILVSLPLIILNPAFAKCTCNVTILRSSCLSVHVSENFTRIFCWKWINPHYRNELRYFQDLIRDLLMLWFRICTMLGSRYNMRLQEDLDQEFIYTTESCGFFTRADFDISLPIKSYLTWKTSSRKGVSSLNTGLFVTMMRHSALYHLFSWIVKRSSCNWII